MRRGSPNTDHGYLTSSSALGRGVATAFATSTAFPPSLPPLVEDSAFLSDGVSQATVSSVVVSSLPPPESEVLMSAKANVNENGSVLFDTNRQSSASHSDYTSSSAQIQLARPTTPTSYFQRRSDSLSSTVSDSSQNDSKPATSDLPLLNATSSSSPPSSPNSLLGPASPNQSPIRTEPFHQHQHHHTNFHPFSSPTSTTIPLQPCCVTCIATLDAHPSSLRPIATEKEAHWSARARAKKAADEREEEAIRLGAEVATNGFVAQQRMPNKSGDLQEKWGEEVLERLWTSSADGARSPSTSASIETADIIGSTTPADAPAVSRRTPLSPESLRRNRELRASFPVQDVFKETNADDRKDVSTKRTDVGQDDDSDDELRKNLDLVDLGVQALRARSRLPTGPSSSSDGDGSASDEVLEDEECDDGTSSTPPSEDRAPTSSLHLRTSSAPASIPVTQLLLTSTTRSPTISSIIPPQSSQPVEPKRGFMGRLRRGSASSSPNANLDSSATAGTAKEGNSNTANESRSRASSTPSLTPTILRSSHAKPPSNLGSITLNPFSSFGRLPGVTS